MIALLVVVLALVALPSSAVAAVTVTEFEVEPSSLQAGGHPSVTITQSFQYSSGTDDGKDTFVRLAPGLLGNPQNAAQCTSEQLRTTAGCPAEAKVGSVEATARPILAGLPGPMTLAVPGTVYNLRPKGGEPARLGLELQALGGLTKTYLEAPANLRPGPDGIGLETLFADQPRDAGLDIQIEGIALTFDAKASKGTFMRMPRPVRRPVPSRGPTPTRRRRRSPRRPSALRRAGATSSASPHLRTARWAPPGRSAGDRIRH